MPYRTLPDRRLQRDPDRKKLLRALEARLAFGRARAVRERLVQVVAALSVLMFPLAAWPGRFTHPVRGFLLWAWTMGVTGLVTAWIQERLRLRRCTRYLPRI